MNLKAKAFQDRSLWLALALASFLLSGLRVFGDDHQAASKTVSQDSYELRFLGCKLNSNTNLQTHTGIFLFIWKGQNPIKILTYPSTGKETFDPYPSFRVHYESGWRSAGGWEGPTDWVTIQPGQVISFSMGMGWIESALSAGSDIKYADKARLNLVSKDGDILSGEFSLPLLPKVVK
jgi:hypothetical protein